MNIVLVMNYDRTILYQHVFAALGLLLRLELVAAVLYSCTLECDLTLCAWHCVHLMNQLPQAPSQPKGGPHHRQDDGVDERGLPLRVLSFQANLTCSNWLCGAALAERRWYCSWAIHGLPRLLCGRRLRWPPTLNTSSAPRFGGSPLTTSSRVSYSCSLLTVATPAQF
jgi:hypothetical protein